jgi:hypothetical protein
MAVSESVGLANCHRLRFFYRRPPEQRNGHRLSRFGYRLHLFRLGPALASGDVHLDVAVLGNRTSLFDFEKNISRFQRQFSFL